MTGRPYRIVGVNLYLDNGKVSLRGKCYGMVLVPNILESHSYKELQVYIVMRRALKNAK